MNFAVGKKFTYEQLFDENEEVGTSTIAETQSTETDRYDINQYLDISPSLDFLKRYSSNNFTCLKSTQDATKAQNLRSIDLDNSGFQENRRRMSTKREMDYLEWSKYEETLFVPSNEYPQKLPWMKGIRGKLLTESGYSMPSRFKEDIDFMIGLFLQKRFFKTSKGKNPCHDKNIDVQKSRDAFIEQYEKDPVSVINRLEVAKQNYMSETFEGAMMNVHMLSMSKYKQCMVPITYNCIMCITETPKYPRDQIKNADIYTSIAYNKMSKLRTKYMKKRQWKNKDDIITSEASGDDVKEPRAQKKKNKIEHNISETILKEKNDIIEEQRRIIENQRRVIEDGRHIIDSQRSLILQKDAMTSLLVMQNTEVSKLMFSKFNEQSKQQM